MITVEEMLKQRSFFPLYPPKEDTPIDISQYKLYEMPYAPDVFVCFSELPQFVDYIEEKTVFVNPGQAGKSVAKGSYGVITINNDVASSNLKDKIRVDIKKL